MEKRTMDRRSSIVLVAAAAAAWAVLNGCSAAPATQPTGSGGGGQSAGGSGGIGTGGSSAGGSSNVGGFGGGPGTGGIMECAAVAQEAANQYRPVDVIWAVDTSDSMVLELEAVQSNLNGFYAAIQGIDAHVVMIGTRGAPDDGDIFNPDPGFCIDPPLGSGGCPDQDNLAQPTTFFHLDVSVGSNNALNRFVDQYPNYKFMLRQNAVKYFAVVTDDDADMSAAQFSAAVPGLDPGWFDVWKFFGIFCTGSCGTFLACADTGSVYQTLVNQTGGVAGDLCANQQNFAPVFQALAQSVNDNKQLDCSWEIPPPPAGQTFDQNKVNVKYTPSNGGSPVDVLHVSTSADCGPEGGWYYDDNASPTTVLVCPSTCSTIQGDLEGKIDILFGCDTVDVPK